MTKCENCGSSKQKVNAEEYGLGKARGVVQALLSSHTAEQGMGCFPELMVLLSSPALKKRWMICYNTGTAGM